MNVDQIEEEVDVNLISIQSAVWQTSPRPPRRWRPMRDPPGEWHQGQGEQREKGVESREADRQAPSYPIGQVSLEAPLHHNKQPSKGGSAFQAEQRGTTLGGRPTETAEWGGRVTSDGGLSARVSPSVHFAHHQTRRGKRRGLRMNPKIKIQIG